MAYETITVQELPNRQYTAEEHSFKSFTGQYAEKPLIETTFVILQHQPEGWWNILETTDEQVAIDQLAKFQKQNAAAIATFAQSKKAHIRALAVPTEFKIVVIEPEKPVIEEPVQAEPVEEVQEVVEQSVEASEATTSEQTEVAKSGKFEVEVSAIGKPFTAYCGDSLEIAKATVATHVGKCIRVQTRIHLSANESFWVYPGKRANGLAWDKHEQWLSDLHAGKFDQAYARDYVNDLVLQGKQQEAEREASWFRQRGINV